VEWVEVKGRTVEVAVEAAMVELGIKEPDLLIVEVIQEPERGFLGLGGKDAIVRVRPKPKSRPRRREQRSGSDRKDARPNQGGQPRDRGQPPRQGSQRRDGERREPQGDRPRQGERSGQGDRSGQRQERREFRPAIEVDPNAQAPAVKEFLVGLINAFGLEGQVEVRVDEDVIIADVRGEQTEALVGPRGSVIEAVHELSRTVLHRRDGESSRVRLDIAGYAERRRRALTIYADQLIDQISSEGGEIMLEPMSASDRKVIHDAVAARSGVRSYSEGEAPRRYVVIATEQPSPEEDSGPEDDLGPEAPAAISDTVTDEGPDDE
jgi:spoIIIJ-associated protein